MNNESRHDGASMPCPGNTRKWAESNRALARLLAGHRRALEAAVTVAEAIGRGIDELAPRMAALCRRTCQFCPEPCCVTHTVWFDFKDVLFFHLTGAPIPMGQAAAEPNTACPFLGQRGCRQPPRIRPWMCTQYVCPPQRSILARQGHDDLNDLLARIEAIERQRDMLEAEVGRCIRNGRRNRCR